MKIETWFDVENGIELWHNLPEFKKQREALKNKDCRYLVSYTEVKNIRSLKQNNTFFGIAYMFFEKALIESGEFINPSKKQIHKWCLINFAPQDYIDRIYEEWEREPAIKNIKTGKVYKDPFVLTSTKMTTLDAVHYYENMQNGYSDIFSSGNEDQIPDPDKKLSKKNIKN